MSVKYRSGRQEVVAAELEVTVADLLSPSSLAGVAQNAIEVPRGARLVGGDVVVTEVFNSTTSDTLKLGDAADDDRYTGSAVNLQALGRTALTLTGYEHSVSEFLKTLWASGGGTPTTGKFRITLLYVVKGRSAFNQGLDFRAPGVLGA